MLYDVAERGVRGVQLRRCACNFDGLIDGGDRKLEINGGALVYEKLHVGRFSGAKPLF